jgi:hypothetical protein
LDAIRLEFVFRLLDFEMYGEPQAPYVLEDREDVRLLPAAPKATAPLSEVKPPPLGRWIPPMGLHFFVENASVREVRKFRLGQYPMPERSILDKSSGNGRSVLIFDGAVFHIGLTLFAATDSSFSMYLTHKRPPNGRLTPFYAIPY